MLRARVPGLSLVFAGGETLFDYRNYRAEFDRRAHDLGVEPVVLGAVADDVLPPLVAACDAFAFPSTKEDSGWPPWRHWLPAVPWSPVICRFSVRCSVRPCGMPPILPTSPTTSPPLSPIPIRASTPAAS